MLLSTLSLPPHHVAHRWHSFKPLLQPPQATLFPYTTLFRSRAVPAAIRSRVAASLASVPGKLGRYARRSEEHTSELQSHVNLVCLLLLEKKNEARSRWIYASSRCACVRAFSQQIKSKIEICA